MTIQEQSLTPAQKELVAVGASVGAGCHPCVSHHLKAGAKAGLDGEQLLAAVISAERVTAEAAVALGDHARGKLGQGVTSPALLSRLEEALASLGSALGANDVTNIERQLHAAVELGASRQQLEQAIETAHSVQENAARIHRREAERLLDTFAAAIAGESRAQSDEGCGCGAADDGEPQPTRATASQHVGSSGGEPDEGCGAGCGDEESQPGRAEARPSEPVGTTSGPAPGCGDLMAGFFAATSPAGPMAACRELFGQFMGASAPAETEKTPTATVAAGSCKKEV